VRQRQLAASPTIVYVADACSLLQAGNGHLTRRTSIVDQGPTDGAFAACRHSDALTGLREIDSRMLCNSLCRSLPEIRCWGERPRGCLLFFRLNSPLLPPLFRGRL